MTAHNLVFWIYMSKVVAGTVVLALTLWFHFHP